MAKVNKKQRYVGRYGATGFYDQRFIDQVVREVEGGLPRKAACIEYGVNGRTLKEWMRKFASAEYRQAHKGRFSASVKRSAVRAVEDGRMSLRQAEAAHGIKNQATIKKWMEQFERENAELVSSNTSTVGTKKPTDPPAEDLQSVNEDLKKQLEEAQLKIAALNTLIDVAEEQLKINIRKKPGAKQSYE